MPTKNTRRPSRSRSRCGYGQVLYWLGELREAVDTLEDTTRIARRVLGGAHPLTAGFEEDLRDARAALRARETPPSSGSV